jgi:hypothetical protein
MTAGYVGGGGPRGDREPGSGAEEVLLLSRRDARRLSASVRRACVGSPDVENVYFAIEFALESLRRGTPLYPIRVAGPAAPIVRRCGAVSRPPDSAAATVSRPSGGPWIELRLPLSEPTTRKDTVG